ncbi:hypothetical protein niasHT_007344 [Heterodera trifolii]|uniref:Uncharacterized protein n=1 Tax=Heterodera trifolii TaxID=157864 RepID=A0ABD2LLM0_9BILA
MASAVNPLKAFGQIGARLGIREKKNQFVQKAWPYIDPGTHFGKKNFGYLISAVSALVYYKVSSSIKSKKAIEAKQKLEMKPYVVQDAMTRSGI